MDDMSPEEMAEMQRKNCIFCKIVAGEVPSKKVYEDDHILAIMDIRPATPGHILVMPKEHYPILPLIPGPVKEKMFKTTRELVMSVKRGVPAASTTVFMANGGVAGQQSPHFIYHIIPREANDGLPFDIPKKEISQTDLKEPLAQNMGVMMKKYLASKGMLPNQEASQDNLAMLLEQNPEIKQALIENPEEFKKIVEGNPQIAQVFQGVDIDLLSKKLKEQTSKEEPDRGEQAADLDRISRLFK